MAGLSDEEKAAALDGRKIDALKAYRERTGAGLREALDAFEEVMPKPVKSGNFKDALERILGECEGGSLEKIREIALKALGRTK